MSDGGDGGAPVDTDRIVCATQDAPTGGIGARVIRLAAECRDRDMPLLEFFERTEGCSPLLLMFLISLPFCQPVPLPGLSTPFGLLLFFLGGQMALGRELTLPRRFHHVVVPKKFFPAVLSGAGRILRFLEKHLRPRNPVLAESPFARRIFGANIALASALLALPLPIPFSNVVPAIPIALSAASLLERDGVMLRVAAALFAVNLLFWTIWTLLIVSFGWVVVDKFSAWLDVLLWS